MHQMRNRVVAQTRQLEELRNQVASLQDAGAGVRNMQMQVKELQANVAECMSLAKRIVDPKGGVGELARDLAVIKGKAVEQDAASKMVKDTVDKLGPGAAAMGPAALA